MPEPELNDLLKLLEKKYTKKPEGAAGASPTPPPTPPAASQAPTPPASGQAPAAPVSGQAPVVPPAGQVPPRPAAASTPPAKPAAASVPPPPRPAGPPPKAPIVAEDGTVTPPPPSVSPSLAAMFPQQQSDRPAPPAGGGMISGIAVPRRGNMPMQGGRRPPPPMSSGFGAPAGVPSRFGGPATPSGFGTGAPPASAFGAGAPSAFGAGRPSTFGGGADMAPPPPTADDAAASTPAAAAQKSNEPAEAHYGLVVKAIRKPLNTALRQVEGLNIVRAIRPRLGREVSQWMFRAACFQGLMQAHGRDFNPWSLLAGRKFGQLVQIPDYESIDKAFRSMKIGRVTYTEGSNTVTFDVAECMICANILGIDEPCCGFVGGLLGSVVQRVTDRDVIVKETQCMVRHADACRFEVTYSRGVTAADL